MLILGILGIACAFGLVLGVPVGIWSGIKAASGMPIFWAGTQLLLIINVIVVILIAVAFIILIDDNFFVKLRSDGLPYLRDQLWGNFILFVLIPAVLWFPIYGLTFVITRFVAA